MIWQCRNFNFDTKMPIIMGILNVTPDSFSDGGEYENLDAAIEHAKQMVAQGASIIDVGGESTRPGAEAVDCATEWERVAPVVRALAEQGICVSIDTRHADVARKAVEAGASIINDVTGFADPAMIEVACESGAGCVVMHCGLHFARADATCEGTLGTGVPECASSPSEYTDIVSEVCTFLRERCAQLEAAGIPHECICVDPGPGFGKTPKQTIELMRNLHEVVHLGYPVMCAASRKSYVGYAYKIDDPKERDVASAAEAVMACELGASVVRTHNVEVTAQGLGELRPYVLLGFGSNVALVAEPGEETEAKIAQINMGIGQLCMLPDSQIIDIASFYGSEPAYYEDQEDFVNTVVLMRTGIPPKELLGYIHGIENSLGRVREIENGPRTLDIDILDYQTYNFSTEELTLPHPRVQERDFVVKPLLEILPGHVLANGVAVDCVSEAERVGQAHLLSS